MIPTRPTCPDLSWIGTIMKIRDFHRGKRVFARFGYRKKHETRSNFTKRHQSLLRKNMVAGNQSQCSLFCSRGHTGLPETVETLNFPHKNLGMNSEQAHIPGLLKSIQNLGWRVVLVLTTLMLLWKSWLGFPVRSSKSSLLSSSRGLNAHLWPPWASGTHMWYAQLMQTFTHLYKL